ncbi:MAG: PilZ domain-containing protein [Clostridia bacterium]|nr:PilZ domain-containing protein [Deltaproteobacteria bacterium]
MKGEISIAVLSRYFRVPSRQFIAVDYPGRDMLLKSRVTNISNNGIFVSCNNPMPRGSEFEVNFQVPGEKAKVTALCVVRWSTVTAQEEGAPTSAQGMGLEFVKIARKDKKAIEKYIRAFLSTMRAKAEAGTDMFEDPKPDEK